MAWWRIDDEITENPKFDMLSSWEPDLLWHKCGPRASRGKTRGIVYPAMLMRGGAAAHIASKAKILKAAKELVTVELWHDEHTVKQCTPCMQILVLMDLPDGKLPEGAYLYHGWKRCNPWKDHEDDDIAKFKESRARQLKNMVELKGRVFARDRGRCRYCRVQVTTIPNDQKSKTRRVYDHVDPLGDNTYENLVIACGRCNGIKKDRTPDDAGMTLLPPPDGYVPSLESQGLPMADPGHAGSSPIEDKIEDTIEDGPRSENEPDRDPASRDARDGSGRVGTRSGPGSVGAGRAGPGSVGLGLVGLGGVGPGMAGIGLAGAVRAGSGAAGPGAPPSPQPPEPNDATSSPATDPRSTPDG